MSIGLTLEALTLGDGKMTSQRHEGVMVRRVLPLLLVIGCAGCDDPYFTGPNSLYAAVFGPRVSKPTPAPSGVIGPRPASVSTSVNTTSTVIAGNTVVQQTVTQQTVVQPTYVPAPVTNSATPIPTPKPTQGPVRYGGKGGRGLFGPFYLDAGIQRVNFSFKAEDHGKYETRSFQASLNGTKESNFVGVIVAFSTSILSPERDNIADFNNIQAPYDGNYWIEIVAAEGDWQIDISKPGDSATAPNAATPTPGASVAPFPTITQFNAVSVGMTYAQVVEVLGTAGAKTYESSVGDTVYTTYEWKMSGCSDSSAKGTVEFTDGKVKRSYQHCQ